MTPKDKERLISYLRGIGQDAPEDGSEAFPECSVFEEKDEDGYGHCPKHGNCGICRYEYMKQKGWLKEESE